MKGLSTTPNPGDFLEREREKLARRCNFIMAIDGDQDFIYIVFSCISWSTQTSFWFSNISELKVLN